MFRDIEERSLPVSLPGTCFPLYLVTRRTPTVLTVRGLGDADLSIDEQGEFDEDEEAADEDAGAEELGSAWSAESMGENVAVDEVVEGDEDDDNEAEEGFEDAEEVELLGEFTLEGEVGPCFAMINA